MSGRIRAGRGRGRRSSVARKVDLKGETTDVIGSRRSRPTRGERTDVMGSERIGASEGEERGDV